MKNNVRVFPAIQELAWQTGELAMPAQIDLSDEQVLTTAQIKRFTEIQEILATKNGEGTVVCRSSQAATRVYTTV